MNVNLALSNWMLRMCTCFCQAPKSPFGIGDQDPLAFSEPGASESRGLTNGTGIVSYSNAQNKNQSL